MMLRSSRLAGVVVLTAALALFLLAIGAPVTSGAVSAGQPATPSSMAPPAPAPAECAKAPTDSVVAALDIVDGGVCRAESSAATTPEWMRGGRTCRCSCGYPCKSDADCGGGIGSCRAGISCC